ncbi:hypothetical protein Sme01_17700 [Sphaerisporangium melleum]|uniref:Uncharacterized protein n=1 Tax=Sphaerisporangium melleum TaxID=321316 RepID=A0A917VIS0_9ACTN|nr:hypothetical protein [Sphaerisporangium melleum]GGK83609.1 hypothetical protein GCM10007964_27640 [Sphaerisporangium melleum]GII69294.1 hypothetical protein Sme01_17700 [Sphaerisporangium melleum]
MLAVRAGTPYLPWHDPREATRLLRYALHREGFTHTYQSSANGMSVLSVTTELTVWCRGGTFLWTEDGLTVTHPSDDPAGAAQLVKRRLRRPIEEEPGTTRAHDSGGRPPTGSVR